MCCYYNSTIGFLLLWKVTHHTLYTGFKSDIERGEKRRRPGCRQGDDFLLISCFCSEEGSQLPTPASNLIGHLNKQQWDEGANRLTWAPSFKVSNKFNHKQTRIHLTLTKIIIAQIICLYLTWLFYVPVTQKRSSISSSHWNSLTRLCQCVCVCVYDRVCVDVGEGGGWHQLQRKTVVTGAYLLRWKKSMPPSRSATLHTPAKLKRPLDRKSFFSSFFFFFVQLNLFSSSLIQ